MKSKDIKKPLEVKSNKLIVYSLLIACLLLALLCFKLTADYKRLASDKGLVSNYNGIPLDKPGVWIGTDKPIAHVILDLSDPNQKSAAAQIQEYLRANKIGYYNATLKVQIG